METDFHFQETIKKCGEREEFKIFFILQKIFEII